MEESLEDMWCYNKRFHICVDQSQTDKRKKEAENFPNMAEWLNSQIQAQGTQRIQRNPHQNMSQLNLWI